jgi:hypothetical protein
LRLHCDRRRPSGPRALEHFLGDGDERIIVERAISRQTKNEMDYLRRLKGKLGAQPPPSQACEGGGDGEEGDELDREERPQFWQ